ncbi:two-component system chemotaxis response regulator CheV [Orenia metallireducens]|uniref:Stage 0 sporulation protein A homolog n=1 Tax=Orenia metallireducens TaxID=1413210 RepID=A0A285HEY1_9FIRM|nr:chemotaxis protein [Orenia metallireducens]PRX27685.1 two-component system chemotaxis response regulator CheV [Orenia metallireducens]SNY33396.1 two-component system, chemotaxis family, response regulator CheV [Orenia metallireducens]
MKNNNILLESGTGELEVLKFKVKGVFYAINVIKVKEILKTNLESIQPLPSQPKAVRGITNIRGEVITLIDLREYLNQEIPYNANESELLVILTEFNNIKLLFAVDQVIGISRLKWSDIQKPNNLMGNLVNGIIKSDNQLVNFLDFESILTNIQPSMVMNTNNYKINSTLKEQRENITLAIADDSPTIREILKKTLYEAGYEDLKIFNDGQQLLDYLYELKDKGAIVSNYIQGIITDIEMPEMDGHTLVKHIKNDKTLREIPTLIFSSLITGDLRHKGDAVGVDEQISKPEIEKLINILDDLIL